MEVDGEGGGGYVPGAMVVGADKRGFTWVGVVVGRITAELKYDWSTATTDLITAVSKKAGVSVRAWSQNAHYSARPIQ